MARSPSVRHEIWESIKSAVAAMRSAERRREAEGKRTVLVTLLRYLGLVVLSTSLFSPDLYQPLLDSLWRGLYGLRVYNWSTFETLWTVFWYALFEDLITVVYVNYPEWRLAHQDKPFDKDNPPRKPKGMRRPSRRGYEALTYVAPLLTMDLTMIKKYAGVPLEHMLASGNHDISEMSSSGSHKSTFLAPSLHNFTFRSPLQTQRALPMDPPSSRRLAVELILSFVIYDALFFLFHLALHIIPGLKTWHQPHHTHGEMHPQITNRLSIFERLGLVLLANFSLNIIKSHVLTRTIFIPLFVWLLVEIHTGLNLPFGYDKVLPSGWGGGAKKHAAHHRDGSGGFEPYFNWCDAGWDALCRYTASR